MRSFLRHSLPTSLAASGLRSGPTMRSTNIIGLLLVSWSCSGCSQFKPPTGYTAPSATQDTVSCEEGRHVDDADDGDSQILGHQGRGGYLYSFVDEHGSTVQPSTSEFVVSPGGVEGQGNAMRIHGALTDAGEDVYAGMGFGLTPSTSAYDASQYRGLEFVAKRGPDSSGFVRLKLPDVNTTPEAGKCEECYNDFGVDFEVTEEWVRYVVDFSDLKQEQGWGSPRPENVDATTLFGIQWQVVTKGAPFDIWVDDIAFLGCEES